MIARLEGVLYIPKWVMRENAYDFEFTVSRRAPIMDTNYEAIDIHNYAQPLEMIE